MRASRIAALTVILLAGALSAVWAFLVPIFQAPDEPAHFDYAISIYDAGRLIRLTDGKPDWIVSPYTEYLMRASDFDRIVWRSSMRVPVGYGTRAYFARLDAGAPPLRRGKASSNTISYITALYPFGFYALEALWMRGLSFFSRSLTALFFSARLLCVLLMMLGLYFNYRTALNLGLPRWTSVILVAAIGFLPLTSFVSSYVQPDNLAYALVSGSLFFASEIRLALRLWPIVALGFCLGFLAITKYQFFLSIAIAIVPFVALRLLQAQWETTSRIYAALSMTIPAVLLVAIQKWIVDQSAHGAPGPTMITSAPIRDALAGGIGSALQYVFGTTAAAFTDFFVWGACTATFWQVVGWVDTPIVIGNPAAELWTRAAISLISIAVAVAVIFRLARNAIRLGAVARRGHAAAVARAITADPVLNSYLAFVAIMVTLYVLSDNAYGAEGRQWFPLTFPAFLCFVWYAPRTLGRRHLRLSAMLACLLFGYSLLSAGYALAAVTHRYYGVPDGRYVVTLPPRSQVGSQRDGILWPILSAQYHVSDGRPTFLYGRGAALLVDGSAVMPGSGVVPHRVAVVLDAHTPLPVLTNQYLFPVAEAAHSIQAGYSGFYAPIATSRLSEGPHTIAAYALIPGTERYAAILPMRLFFIITVRNGRLSTALRRALARAPIVAGTMRNAGTCHNGALGVDGRIAKQSAARYSAVWLLAADRPFPARYDAADGWFTATIPALDLRAHSVYATAYAISADSGTSARISQRVALQHGPPVRCIDPLAQLAGV